MIFIYKPLISGIVSFLILRQSHAVPHPSSPTSAAAVAANPSVTIAKGVVVGTTTTLANPTLASSAITKYVGIPFASSPPLRFGPPEPAASWTKPLHATSTMPACIQQFVDPASEQAKEEALFNNPGYAPPQESEDCLYVNVYVPAGTKKDDKKPVLFWIFGGNLAFGTGGLVYYDGTSFATNQDVIVVTHNYRTNVFGFPGSPDLQPPYQNPGFLDQRAALQWTHDNIAAFGGDPGRITIFGESAGGYSVKDLLALPPSPLNFHGAIMESEAALDSTTFIPVGNSSDGNTWEELVMQLNCTTSLPNIACVRSKPATQIKSIIETQSYGYFPVVDNTTHVQSVQPAFTDGTAAKVPFMIGTNQNEFRAFSYLLGLDNNSTNLTAVDSALNMFFPNNPTLVTALEAAYDGQDAYEFVSQVATEAFFLCPASLLAQLAQSHGYTVFRYLYNASFPNEDVFPDAGVWHSSEIPEVFGNYPNSARLGKATSQQIALSKYMQTAWANFAKNPTVGPQEGWPELGTAGNVQDLGANGNIGGKTISAASIDGSCALFDPVAEAQGL